ncbi:MAG: hypothetical protein Q8T08_10040, partial [Ignavibacteria bacterium]|nr:hypothetical protein [Ignavibacteria bacterium]
MKKNKLVRPLILKPNTWKILIITCLLFTFNCSLTICSAQKVIQVNPDSLTVFTPGENGVPFPKTIKAGNPTISANRIAPIPVGEPEEVEINHGELKVFTPRQDSTLLPKTYILP